VLSFRHGGVQYTGSGLGNVYPSVYHDGAQFVLYANGARSVPSGEGV
jgi:hypothetical protein